MWSFKGIIIFALAGSALVEAFPHEAIKEEKYEFKVDYYEQPVRIFHCFTILNTKIHLISILFVCQVDHFSFATNATYKMRYLYNDTYWNASAGAPIFFYTGNEGDIEWFAQNTGFMWDIAPKYEALLLFAEHRYYGESLPFGNDSYKVNYSETCITIVLVDQVSVM